MSYDIDYGSVTGLIWRLIWMGAGGVVLGILLTVASLIWVRPKWLRASLAALGILLAIGWVIALSITGHNARHTLADGRRDAVMQAWGLSENDASFLLANTYEPSEHWVVEDDGYKYYEAVVTIDGKPKRVYLLKQGNALRLMVGKKPIPVVAR